MLEIILILSLGANGWLIYDKGENEQSLQQIEQQLKESTNLVDTYYAQIKSTESSFAQAKEELQNLHKLSTEQTIALEELRHSNSSVRTYLQQSIPAELVELARQASNPDQIQDSEDRRSAIDGTSSTALAVN